VDILEQLDESQRWAVQIYEAIQNRWKSKHNRCKKTIKFQQGDLIMMIDHWLIKQHGHKFRPKWQGPYVIHRDFDNGSYKLNTPEGEILKKIYNSSKLKPFIEREHQFLPTSTVTEDGEEMI